MRRTRLLRWILAAGSVCGVLLGCAGPTSAMVPDWAGVNDPPYPLPMITPINPVLTNHDVTEAYAHFVADPFLFRTDGPWDMFFEAGITQGEICHAVSQDGVNWTYDQIVLDEPFHLSFPFVFAAEGNYYMVPESKAVHEVRLYEATDFPYGWTHVRTLVSGREFVDPVIFYRNGTSWLFVGMIGSACCYLYYSDELTSGWTEHPCSPIVSGDQSMARPAGRIVHFAGDRMLRYAQKCDILYGEAVRVFEIDVLTRYAYHEHEIEESPILRGTGVGWNAIGMHHCDPWWNGDHWLAAVDGFSEDNWAIGIYRTRIPSAAPDSPEFPGSSGPLAGEGFGWLEPSLHLSLTNPALGGQSVPIHYEIGSGNWSGPVELSIFSVADGRLVRRLLDPTGQMQSQREGWQQGHLLWDGRDDLNRPVASGVYLYRLTAGGASISRSALLVR